MDTDSCHSQIQRARVADRLRTFLEQWREDIDGDDISIEPCFLVDALLHADAHKLPKLKRLCAAQLKTFLETGSTEDIQRLAQ